MRYFDHYYPRYQRMHILHYDDLPDTFLAVDDDMTKTFEWLFEHKPDLKTRLLGTRKSELEYFGMERVFLVQRSRSQKAVGATVP